MTPSRSSLVVIATTLTMALGGCADRQDDPGAQTSTTQGDGKAVSGRVVLAEGEGRNGPWALVATDGDDLAIEMREPECSSGVGDYSLPYTLAETHMFVVDDQAFVAGPVTSDVESVEVSSGGGVAETRS